MGKENTITETDVAKAAVDMDQDAQSVISELKKSLDNVDPDEIEKKIEEMKQGE